MRAQRASKPPPLPHRVLVYGVTGSGKIGDIVAGERWLLDSSYGAWLDLVLPRVQLVVGLDYPRWLSFGRLLRRTVSGAVTKEPRCNGNVETWRNMLSRDSILRLALQVVRRELEAWLASLAEIAG